MTTQTPTVGRMQEFNPDNETVTAYLERFQLFADVNNIAEAKLVPTLLTVIGSKHYTLIRGLVSPSLPREKTFEQLVGLLKKHYDPEPNVIYERYQFYQRNQQAGESVAQYMASLRRLASRCNFQDFLSDALRDRFVCGLQSESIVKALLSLILPWRRRKRPPRGWKPLLRNRRTSKVASTAAM